MAIRNIKAADLSSHFPDTLYGFWILDFPDSVKNAIFLLEIIFRLMNSHPMVHEIDQFIRKPACQKNRPRIGIAGIHMANTVFLFLFSGQFMAFHHMVQIIIDGGTAYETSLYVLSHLLLIDIVTGNRIFLIDPLLLHPL